MAYYKVRFEVWCDWNPAESDLDDIAQSMGVGEAICTKREVVAVVDRPGDIEDEEAMAFFGGEEGDADEVRDRPGPGHSSSFTRECDQAVAVRNFFCLISSFARSQSSSA